MEAKIKSIGFFDSGVGGLSVLRESIKLLPNENYIYFGDSKNAPYGVKSVEEVRELTSNAVDFLLNKGVKAIVIACNTATSASIDILRNKYKDIPIIGIEPALKPAVSLNKNGKIIVMATPMTLREIKFKQLLKEYSNQANIISLPCAGLVELIERGITSGNEVESYLKNKLKIYENENIASIVLGCTHYPFIKDTLKKVCKNNVAVIDGSLGTVKQLKRKLSEKNMLNDNIEKGKINIYNSLGNEEIIELSYKLLTLK